jgi:hypothetical protein
VLADAVEDDDGEAVERGLRRVVGLEPLQEPQGQLLTKIAATVTGPTTLVLDNARYQHCAKVKEEAKRLGILLFAGNTSCLEFIKYYAILVYRLRYRQNGLYLLALLGTDCS